MERAKWVILEPPDGSWLKKGEEIRVKSASDIQMGHEVRGKDLISVLQKEVREYLTSKGSKATDFSTCIWYRGKGYDLELKLKPRENEIIARYREI